MSFLVACCHSNLYAGEDTVEWSRTIFREIQRFLYSVLCYWQELWNKVSSGWGLGASRDTRLEMWSCIFGSAENKIRHWRQSLNWKGKQWHWNVCVRKIVLALKQIFGAGKKTMKMKQLNKNIKTYFVIFWYFFSISMCFFPYICLFSVKLSQCHWFSCEM